MKYSFNCFVFSQICGIQLKQNKKKYQKIALFTIFCWYQKYVNIGWFNMSMMIMILSIYFCERCFVIHVSIRY
jgi:hypothetical protein